MTHATQARRAGPSALWGSPVLAFTAVVMLTASMAMAAFEAPELAGRVVDQTGVLSPAAKGGLDAQLAAHERASSNQVVVAILDSLGGLPIEQVGVDLGRAWGIGQQDTNNGVLLIIAPNERKVRIEVGYGLEGELTDAISANIIHTVILPAFKRGDFEGGVRSGTTAIIEALGGQYQMRAARGRSPASGLSPLIFLFFMVAPILFSLGGFGGRRRYGPGGMLLGPGIGGRGGFGGGGFGGGGFGGGGGSFGGGGASGGW